MTSTKIPLSKGAELEYCVYPQTPQTSIRFDICELAHQLLDTMNLCVADLDLLVTHFYEYQQIILDIYRAFKRKNHNFFVVSTSWQAFLVAMVIRKGGIHVSGITIWGGYFRDIHHEQQKMIEDIFQIINETILFSNDTSDSFYDFIEKDVRREINDHQILETMPSGTNTLPISSELHKRLVKDLPFMRDTGIQKFTEHFKDSSDFVSKLSPFMQPRYQWR